jgi:hypothetical protein
MRPPSHGQGVRSAAVSAGGRTPLERLSTNGGISGNQGTGYRSGPLKSVASVGRPAYIRR